MINPVFSSFYSQQLANSVEQEIAHVAHLPQLYIRESRSIRLLCKMWHQVPD